jgi:uncharacterized protein YbjT (DUF2867 family)
MKIAITTPTGHVGSNVADAILEFGGDVSVKLLARRPEKLRDFAEKGAEVAVGSLDDVAYLTKATEDADALFWVTPPSYGSDNLRAFQNRVGEAAATAIRTNRIPRVVNLSSIGAQFPLGVGPIGGLHDVEYRLDDAAENITHLRPGFFFENLLWHLDSIKNKDTISLPLAGSQHYPMIATRDIGDVAAQRLLEDEWSGNIVQELHGPADLSFDEVAGILSKALGRKITYVRCEPQEMRQALLDHALSENVADSMLEMYEAVDSGKLQPIQPRTDETTTPTTLLEFVDEVILPMMAAPVAH